MAFITMILARVGIDGNAIGFGDSFDEFSFGIMVVYGFFFLTIVQIIGIVLGDKNTALVIF